MPIPKGTRAGVPVRCKLKEGKRQMIRNLKALGLALCAAFALSAIGATVASAHVFESDAPAGTEIHLTARQYTEGNTKNIHNEELKGTQEFQGTTGDKKTLKCKEVSAEATPKPPTEEITATNVKYNTCTAWETKENKTVEVAKTFVEFTSCDYLFKGATENTAGPVGTLGEHAKVKIKCNTPGDHIHIKATELKLTCITIPEQEVGGIRYFKDPKDEANKIVIHATTHGIKSTTTNSIACPNEGVAVHDEPAKGGTYTGEITVEGFKDALHKEPTPIKVSGAKETKLGG
jgi:hypothetical protein